MIVTCTRALNRDLSSLMRFLSNCAFLLVDCFCSITFNFLFKMRTLRCNSRFTSKILSESLINLSPTNCWPPSSNVGVMRFNSFLTAELDCLRKSNGIHPGSSCRFARKLSYSFWNLFPFVLCKISCLSRLFFIHTQEVRSQTHFSDLRARNSR